MSHEGDKLEVRFSRHAKRRIRLYGIPETTVLRMLSQVGAESGRGEIVRQTTENDLPIKVVFDVKEASLVVITAYPLKRGRK